MMCSYNVTFQQCNALFKLFDQSSTSADAMCSVRLVPVTIRVNEFALAEVSATRYRLHTASDTITNNIIADADLMQLEDTFFNTAQCS